MATRFHSSFPTLKGETFTINIDDVDFVGTSTEITLDSDGFRHQIGGDGKNRLNPVMGSVINIGVLVDPATETAIEDFAEDLRISAEGRFTIRVDFNDGVGPDELWWVGYILTDLGGFQDLAPAYIYSISATDGLGRLKGIEYKDDSGITDVPYGKLPMLEHLLNCLNQDPLSALYFDASTDIFLQTVVNWQDDNIGSPSAAKCPLAHTRVNGEVFAKPSTANQGDTWVYQNCYEVIRHIAEHFAARIYFSGGCYRFEQINERAQDNYPERRFARDGTLISSTLTASADKLIHNTVASHKVATVLFNYLPALRQVSVKYDHNTNRNYIASTAFKWYKDSLNNDPLNRPDIKFDADSYMRISGRVYFDLSVTTYTEPWRYVFGMDVTLTDGNQLRSLTSAGVDGSGNPINIIIHEPPEWQISSADYEISTDFNYQSAVQSFLDFAVYTPVVPSGPDGFTIDFYPKGGFDNEDNNHSVNLNNWKFGELILIIVGIDNADNYELDRDYKVYNDEVGNSDTLSLKHIFGHAVQKWTPTKLETSSNGSTWLDTTQSWRQGSDATDYEFGQLFATEVMAGAITPLKMLDGTLGGTDFYPHVRIVTNDNIGWLLMSGELRAKSGQWSGSWFQAGTNRSITQGPIIRNPGIPPVFGGSGPGQYNTGSGVKGTPGGTAEIALATQATNYLSSAVAAGTVTSIPLQYPVKANAYLAGDDIFLVNPQTGKMSGFTVATTAADGDTSLSVVSTTLDTEMPKGAYVLYSVLNKFTGEGGDGMNLPEGTLGQILRHDGTEWTAYSGSTDGHVLTWDTTNGWQAEAATVGGGGTVTSVALSLPVALFDVTGSPVTTSGTLTATLDSQSANQVFAGPGSGAPAAPAFRALVADDIPALDAAKITTGTFGIARGGTGLSALGTASQLLRVNAGATALEYFTPTYISGNQTITLSGDVTGSGATAITATIGANAVTDAKFRQSAALSVIGRSANTTGNVADIAAANDGEVLRRSGTTLGFGTVATAGIANAAVTLAKMENRATQTFIGRNTAGSGAPEELSIATAKTMLNLSGTNSGDQTITLTGDVTGSGTGSFAATIGANAVTDAKFRQSAALSVIGRSANTTGNVADIAAANDGEVLRRSGTTLGFGTVATAGIANDAVTYAKMQNVSATQRILGRTTAGAGDVEEMTSTQLLDWLGSTQGSILYRGASAWTALGPGTAGQVLQTNGAAANPSWATAAGGVSGSGSAGHVAYWTSSTNISFDSAQLFWDATNNRLGIGTSSPVSGLQVALATGTSDEGIRVSGSLSANLNNTFTNSNNTSAANTLLNIGVGGTSAGDPALQLSIPGSITWCVGLDNSDSDAFVVATNAVPGTGNRLRIGTGGQVSINSGSSTATVNIGGLGATSATYAMLVNNSGGSSILALRDDRRVGILNPVPTQELDVSGDVIARQYINTSAAPALSSFGTGAGTSPTNNSLAGGVNFFRFLFTTGTSPVNNGDIFTLLLNQSFPSIPIVVMTPSSQSAALEWDKFYVSGAGGNSFTVKANGQLTAGTTYQINFIVGGY